MGTVEHQRQDLAQVLNGEFANDFEGITVLDWLEQSPNVVHVPKEFDRINGDVLPEVSPQPSSDEFVDFLEVFEVIWSDPDRWDDAKQSDSPLKEFLVLEHSLPKITYQLFHLVVKRIEPFLDKITVLTHTVLLQFEVNALEHLQRVVDDVRVRLCEVLLAYFQHEQNKLRECALL